MTTELASLVLAGHLTRRCTVRAESPSLAETAHQSWVREEEELLLMWMMMLWSPSMHVVLVEGSGSL